MTLLNRLKFGAYGGGVVDVLELAMRHASNGQRGHIDFLAWGLDHPWKSSHFTAQAVFERLQEVEPLPQRGAQALLIWKAVDEFTAILRHRRAFSMDWEKEKLALLCRHYRTQTGQG